MPLKDETQNVEHYPSLDALIDALADAIYWNKNTPRDRMCDLLRMFAEEIRRLCEVTQSITTSEAAIEAAQEVVDIAYRDKGQVPHRDTIAAIISQHITPDAGEVERLRGWVEGLQATLLEWSKEMVRLRTELFEAHANLKEAIEVVRNRPPLYETDEHFRSRVIEELESLLDKKEGEDG